MALTVNELMKYVTDAKSSMAAGIHYSALNEGEGWGVVSEVTNGKMTGRIGVVCDDGAVRRAFIQKARELGHTVEVRRFTGPRNTVFVTPV